MERKVFNKRFILLSVVVGIAAFLLVNVSVWNYASANQQGYAVPSNGDSEWDPDWEKVVRIDGNRLTDKKVLFKHSDGTLRPEGTVLNEDTINYGATDITCPQDYHHNLYQWPDLSDNTHYYIYNLGLRFDEDWSFGGDAHSVKFVYDTETYNGDHEENFDIKIAIEGAGQKWTFGWHFKDTSDFCIGSDHTEGMLDDDLHDEICKALGYDSITKAIDDGACELYVDELLCDCH